MKPKSHTPIIPLVILLLFAGVAYAGDTPGDMNCDGIVDYADIDPFVLALGCAGGDPGCWPSACPWINADCDGDDAVTYADIDAFVGLIGTTYETGEITPLELAGNPLTGYPYFEFVKAFNENAPLNVAIDPTLHPEIAGVTADIYVAESKSQAGWAVEPTLIDQTADGPLTVTFSGTTIQDNTFEVAGAYDLNSAVYQEFTGDYTGLGHGYDIIVDVNQNGLLDAGDYIDGFGRESGLYIVHDLTEAGPLAVTETIYSGGTWLDQDLYYPTDIASMGVLPLIVISHGNGHNYQWYDHIGFHMASYGYIVMSHSNNTGPGIESASTTTLTNTDYILGHLGTIAGGVLNGHLDNHRIMWIGHSRGGEGITRAYDRIFDGAYTPVNYVIEDIVLLSSMAPTDFLGTNSANPHGANYHLWTAAADNDVSGTPSNDIAQTFHLHDRATGFRHSTILHGVGHGDLHDGGGSSVASGPCLIGRDRTHLIQKGYFLPLIKYYIEGNVPALDFLWRDWHDLKPIGAPSMYCDVTQTDGVVVHNTCRNMSADGNFMIDDYQTSPALGTSSSGGSVSYTVSNLVEDRLDDNDSTFSWTPSDPMNGMTYGSSSDTTRGAVFDWNGTNCYYEWSIIPDYCNFTNFKYFSCRACQCTQHPYTTASLDDLTFTVTLRDTSGVTSSINIGAYAAGLGDPYQRSGGWHNDFEAVRVRLADFLANGSGIDLTDIQAVRFNFGPSWGSNEGRVGVDEIQLTNDYPPFFTPLTITVPGGPPEFIPPYEPTVISVEIAEGDDTLVEGSATLYYRYDDGAFQPIPLTQIAGELWQGTLPAPQCTDAPQFYFAAAGDVTGTVYAPMTAPTNPFVAFVGTYVSVLVDNFETDLGWTVENDPSLTGGAWERGVPSTDGSYDEPMMDYDGSGRCYVTQNTYHGDVDGGPTYLISPTLDMSGLSNPVLRYARWWANDDQDDDPFDVEVGVYNTDTGEWDWYLVERVTNVDPGWIATAFYINDFVPTLTDQMKVRFSVADVPNNSKDEAALDAVEIFDVTCD